MLLDVEKSYNENAQFIKQLINKDNQINEDVNTFI